jgi:hypothetical protein
MTAPKVWGIAKVSFGLYLEVEYLIFDVLCTIMSIVVLIILYKNQQEEKMKMQQLSFIGRDRPRGSLLS